MSLSTAEHLIWQRLFGDWSRCPVVSKTQRRRWNPDDPEACALFTPSGPPFTPEQVRGTAEAFGVGYIEAGFKEERDDQAFQGIRGWRQIDLVLEVDLFCSDRQGNRILKDHSDVIDGWFWSFDGEPETWQLFETITDVRVPLDASCE